MDVERHRCFINDSQGHPVEATLTPSEWKMLKLLISNSDQMVTYRQLTEAVWGARSAVLGARSSERDLMGVVYWHISNLRKIIKGISGDQTSPIQTVQQFGYRWVQNE